MDAQAIDIGESGSRQPSRSYAVRWRWSLIIFLGVVAAVAFNTAILADEVRVAAIEGFHALPSCRGCTPTYPEPFAIFLIATFACVLAVVAAIPAIVVIGLLGRRVGLRPSAISATALLATLLVASVGARVVTWSSAWLGASEPGATVSSVVIGPAIEETAKASGILIVGIVMAWRLGIRAGIVLGAAAGLLVTVFEIGLYVQLNVASNTNTAYGAVIATRLGLFGLGVHVVATAIAGAGIGAWLVQDRPRQSRVLVASLAAAIVVHGLWNLVGSTLISRFLIALYPDPDFAMPEPFPISTLFVASSAAQLVVLGLPILALVVVWRRDAARAPLAGPSSTSPGLELSQP